MREIALTIQATTAGLMLYLCEDENHTYVKMKINIFFSKLCLLETIKNVSHKQMFFAVAQKLEVEKWMLTIDIKTFLTYVWPGARYINH